MCLPCTFVHLAQQKRVHWHAEVRGGEPEPLPKKQTQSLDEATHSNRDSTAIAFSISNIDVSATSLGSDSNSEPQNMSVRSRGGTGAASLPSAGEEPSTNGHGRGRGGAGSDAAGGNNASVASSGSASHGPQHATAHGRALGAVLDGGLGDGGSDADVAARADHGANQQPLGPCGLKNHGNTCYFKVCLQALLCVGSLHQIVSAADLPSRVVVELDRVLAAIEHSKHQTLVESAALLQALATPWFPTLDNESRDAMEAMGLVMQALPALELELSFTLESRQKRNHGQDHSTIEASHVWSLPLAVRPGATTTELVQSFFEPEHLDDMVCGLCEDRTGTKQLAVARTSLNPPYLLYSLKRFRADLCKNPVPVLLEPCIIGAQALGFQCPGFYRLVFVVSSGQLHCIWSFLWVSPIQGTVVSRRRLPFVARPLLLPLCSSLQPCRVNATCWCLSTVPNTVRHCSLSLVAPIWRACSPPR